MRPADELVNNVESEEEERLRASLLAFIPGYKDESVVLMKLSDYILLHKRLPGPR